MLVLEVLVMLVLLVFNANYVIDITEITEIVTKIKFWKNLTGLTDRLSEKVTTREAIASKNITGIVLRKKLDSTKIGLTYYLIL